ncbi:MAG TPA: 4-hydroxy-tetrahydrodipicolinate reductase [Bacteroidales bacterium]|nr:4-hydroxy-tetrahydrodipicolinate reductase [Bacteroidales bacterium]
MNIAIIGYGKMGKIIEQIAQKKGHSIGLIIDVDNTHELNAKNLKQIDCAIEFTTPQAAVNNFLICFENNIPIVSGTTGWTQQLELVKRKCLENNGSFFHASNFSLGVNIFFKINNYLAQIMHYFDDYNVAIEETHHIHKLDKPSGTAITLANQILKHYPQKKQWSLPPASNNELEITAHRKGNIVGIHTITYQSQIDKITISHEAFSRQGFANGAIIAAEFLKGKKGIYSMNDLLESFNIN